jgi:hypothetical protein
MTDEAMSPLRRRMIEDMTIRKFAPKTQHDYVQRVKNFTAFLGRSPDTASFEDVRRYQLHLAASGVGVPTVNQTVSTLPPNRQCKAEAGSLPFRIAPASWFYRIQHSRRGRTEPSGCSNARDAIGKFGKMR